MANTCVNCGSELIEGSAFCDNCGHPVEAAEPAAEPIREEPVQEKEEALQESAVSAASAQIGEAAFGLPIVKEAAEKLSPFKTIGTQIKSLISSIGAAFKEPKKLIPAFVLAGVWITLDLLKSFGIEPFPAKALSFLTFANGGLHGGVLGAIGGLIGKGLFAGAAVSLLGLLTKKNTGEKRSFGESLKGAFGFDMNTIWAYLTGAGAAMLICLFITGGSTRMGFMGGAAASYLAARAALKDGFLTKFFSSFAAKGKETAGENVRGLIRGLAAGFASGAVIGLANVKLILIILGCLLLTGGAVMMILQSAGVLNKGKEAAVQ